MKSRMDRWSIDSHRHVTGIEITRIDKYHTYTREKYPRARLNANRGREREEEEEEEKRAVAITISRNEFNRTHAFLSFVRLLQGAREWIRVISLLRSHELILVILIDGPRDSGRTVYNWFKLATVRF